MTDPIARFGRRILFVLSLALAVTRGFAARNDVAWDFVNFPATGTAGQTINFSAGVTNTGEQIWGIDYYLELRDGRGTHVSFVGLATTPPRAGRLVRLALKLPEQPGTYTYQLTALQHGGGYFGAVQSRTIVVRRPIAVSLVIDDPEITVGQRTMLRSTAGPRGDVKRHGLEARLPGRAWERWFEWSADGAGEQVAFPEPAIEGVYEVHAFAVRAGDDEIVFSERVFLTVTAPPPAITQQPASVVANLGEIVTLSVAASGPALSYQWRQNGVDLPGATGPSLTLAPAQPGQGGSYAVVVSNRGGSVVSRAAAVSVAPLALPPVEIEIRNFPGSGGQRSVPATAAQVGDVISIGAVAPLTAAAGWRHNVLVRRPAITTANALAPEDGSGLTGDYEAWNRDGWGNPHTDGGSYDARVTGSPAVDLGNREPFIHPLAAGQEGSTRAIDFVLDAPGAWTIRTEVVDAAGQTIAVSPDSVVKVAAPALTTDVANLSYPYGRGDRFVGVFWNAGQAHRLWSTWRADHQTAYRDTWAVNWKLMWQPSPYFRRTDGGWLRPSPAADSPWQPFWSAHQVYALVPDAGGAGRLTHDLTSRAFAEKAAVRLMDVGVDFVAVDYTNQFLEEKEAVLPALDNLAQAFQAVAAQSQSGERIRLTAVVPANVDSGDWAGNGGFGPVTLARFTAKLTTLFNRYARFPAAWFHLEDDDGARKPLLLLWIGASGESESDGKLPLHRLSQLKLADGRTMTEAFTLRWVGAYLPNNRRFLTGANYTAPTPSGGTVTGHYANAKIWSYHENFPAAATVMPGAAGAAPAVEAITVQPLAAGRDRFSRAWDMNWPAGQGYHYETPTTTAPIPLANYGRTWRAALAAARSLNPKFLLTTWAEFGSENDEPRPELSVTIMDNNKFGTHFGDALRDAVRLFKYREPAAWIDTFTINDETRWLSGLPAGALPPFHREQTVRLQGWVAPNVATTFAGGSVRVYVDDELLGEAAVGGAWNGATRWFFDLALNRIGRGQHAIKVLADDGVGGSALAGVQFRGERPGNVLSIMVGSVGAAAGFDP